MDSKKKIFRSITRKTVLSYGTLESRQLLASIYHDPGSGKLYLSGDNGDNVATVKVDGGFLQASVDDQAYVASASDVTRVIFKGFNGDDTFTNQTSIPSSAYGNAGEDTLSGGSGKDNLLGGPGNDKIFGNDGDDYVNGVDGNNRVEGGNGNDRIIGGIGNDAMFGGDGDDILFGGPGDDEMHGDAGRDGLFAGAGNDKLYSGAGGKSGGSFREGELMMGLAGDDIFVGGGGLDIFLGGDGNDMMTGGSGENRMQGQKGHDTMVGGPNSDFIAGGTGNDSLQGGAGKDFLRPGAGDDTVVFSEEYQSGNVEATGKNAATVKTGNGIEHVAGARWIEFSDRTISGNQEVSSPADQANYDHLNEYRVAEKRVQLSKPMDLADYAKRWSQSMARKNRLEHSAISSLKTLLTDGRTNVGENVIYEPDTGQSVEEIAEFFHNRWRNSPGHNANLLGNKFTEVGISIIKSGGKWWGTQVFVG